MKLAAPFLVFAMIPLSAVANESVPGKGYLTEVELSYKGEVIYSVMQRVGQGMSSPTSVGKTVNYVKSVSWDAGKRETTTVRGELKTGTTLSLAARPDVDGALLVDIKLDSTKLVEMNSHNAFDQTVEFPNLTVAKVDDTIKVAKSGDGWDYRAPMKQEGFTLSIRMRTGDRI